MADSTLILFHSFLSPVCILVYVLVHCTVKGTAVLGQRLGHRYSHKSLASFWLNEIHVCPVRDIYIPYDFVVSYTVLITVNSA